MSFVQSGGMTSGGAARGRKVGTKAIFLRPIQGMPGLLKRGRRSPQGAAYPVLDREDSAYLGLCPW